MMIVLLTICHLFANALICEGKEGESNHLVFFFMATFPEKFWAPPPNKYQWMQKFVTKIILDNLKGAHGANEFFANGGNE